MSTFVLHLSDPDDLERLPDDCEFVRGEPVEKPMGAESDEIAGALLTLLRLHVSQQSLGRVFGSQTGFRCFPHAAKLVRKPDVSFVVTARLPGGKVPKGDFNIAPDFAVESVSPNETYEEVEEKLNDYFRAGVPLVWVISPNSRTVQVRRADGTAAVVRDGGTLSGEGVVPGFACAVADLFM